MGIFFYAFGIYLYIDSKTTENVKFHDGGFLGLGYTTCGFRETTAKDARMSLLWPILLALLFTKTIAWMLHNCLSFIPLLLGFNYKSTKTYKYIDKKLDV